MKKILFICFVFFYFPLYAQIQNMNLLDIGSGCRVDSASSNAGEAFKTITNNLEEAWNTAKETSGAWIKISFDQPKTIKEVWILSKPIFSFANNAYSLRNNYHYQSPKNISISFSDGSSENVNLKQVDDFQIISLQKEKMSDFIKIKIFDVWQEKGAEGTGIGKIKVFSKPNELTYRVNSFELYNGIDNKPVKQAKISIINPGSQMQDVHLTLFKNKNKVDDIKIGTVDAHQQNEKTIWTYIPQSDTELDAVLYSGNKIIGNTSKLSITAYKKTYFDGGEFLIQSTNHNDLGWLDTQFETANYRSKELILPAMKLMEQHPEYCYTMEAVEYLKEFLERHPEKRSEMEKLIREKRFYWGASYTLTLQSQVGPEKLARQFYYGRRWLKENIKGADSKIFINADVPMLTYQLPQLLKSAGVEYLSQARIPLGFYYWQGLDGTTIPMYGLRYGNSPKIMPKNNDEWLPFLYKREKYYAAHHLPKVMTYDYNEDYLPPNAEYIPFVKDQNEKMKHFADAWNIQYKDQKEKQTQPPVLKFSNTEDMLKEIFSKTDINIETIKGEWPNQWAYYDEPGNREALLTGRKAHNLLLSAEKLFSFVKMLDTNIVYPKEKFDAAWMANCWPDHGWGGAKGLISDSVYHDSYQRSFNIAQDLMHEAIMDLNKQVHNKNTDKITIVVYNSLNWNRNEATSVHFNLPKDWKGFILKNKNNESIPFEILNKNAEGVDLLFNAEVPSLGFNTYYVEAAKEIQSSITDLKGDSIDLFECKIVFGNAGIMQYLDKIKDRRYFKTDKFQAGEVLQFSAPGNAWDDLESMSMVNNFDFDRSGNYQSKTTRFVETPLRYIRESETQLKNFKLHQRYIVLKNSKDIELEVELEDWNGAKNKEVRIAFPMNIEQKTESGLSTVPASCLKTPDGKNKGLLAEYFDNPNLSGKAVFSQIDENMAPYWDKNSPGKGVPSDFFSVRWTGTISVDETGDYTLGIITDDKGNLYFEDKLVVNNWNPYELNVMKTFKTRMEKGKEYKIKIEYAEIVEYAGIRFQWKKEESPDSKLNNKGQISYEIPFGAVDYNKDEVDFSQFPDNVESQFYPQLYGAVNKLPYREALNWVNVSTGTYKGYGCMFASDITVHLFEDQTSNPVNYPVVQHVLLSSRKSLAWNPEYWFDQKGNHKYRMAMYFHDGNWRMRYRDGMAFNYPLIAFVATENNASKNSLEDKSCFVSAEPSNIIITSIKQSEDGKGTVVRFYEAEGKKCNAHLKMLKPIKEAFKTNLLEYEPLSLPLETDGSLIIGVKPWEIITLYIK
ncbi:MAG: PA14 domain-containing protein [Bacteroidota bacterium]